MNQGKEGRPYKLTPTYIQFLTAFRILHSVPYRQLEGFTRALHRLVPQLPPGDYSGLRKRSLCLNLDPYRALRESDEPPTIAVDSTGVKVHRAGGWVERKHGKKKRYVKLHFAVDVETKEGVAMEVSTDDVHDVKAFRGLLEEAEEMRRVSGLLGDGAYDSGMVFEAPEELVCLDRHRIRGLRNVTVHVALCIIAMLLVAVAALRLGVPERVRCVVSFGWG